MRDTNETIAIRYGHYEQAVAHLRTATFMIYDAVKNERANKLMAEFLGSFKKEI